jgi:hypothetical protein
MAQSEAKPEQNNAETDTEPTPRGRLEAYDGDAESLCFDGEIAGDRLETLARHFTDLLDDVKLTLTSDGLFYRESNSGNTALGEIYLPAEAWESFNCLSSGTVGLNLEGFYDVARRCGTSSVELSIGGRTYVGDRDTPSLLASEGNIFSGIDNLQDPETLQRSPQLPDLKFTATVALADGNQLREFIKAHTKDKLDSAVSVTVSVPTKRDELAGESESVITFESATEDVDPLVATGNSLEEGVTFTGGIEYDGYGVSGDVHSDVADAHDGNIVVVQSYYTARFLKQAFGTLRKTETEGVPYTVEFAAQEMQGKVRHLLRLTREFPEGGHAQFLLAPRLDCDE